VDVLELDVHVRCQALHGWLTWLHNLLLHLFFYLHSLQYKTNKLATPHHVLMVAFASTLVITTAANVRVDTMEGSVSRVCFVVVVVVVVVFVVFWLSLLSHYCVVNFE